MDWKNEIYKTKRCLFGFYGFTMIIKFNEIYKKKENHVGIGYIIYITSDFLNLKGHYIYYEWTSEIYKDECLINRFKTSEELLNDIIKKHNLYIFAKQGENIYKFIENYNAVMITSRDNCYDMLSQKYNCDMFCRLRFFKEEVIGYINEFVNNFIYKSKNIHLRKNRTFNKFICNKIWNHYNNNFARSDIYELIEYERLYPYVDYNYKKKYYIFI